MPSLGVKKGYCTLEQLVQTNQENWQTPHVKMTPQKKSGDVLTEQGNWQGIHLGQCHKLMRETPK